MKTERAACTTAEVVMLGRFSITVGGRTISDEMNRTHKLWNILAYLIAHRGRMVPQSEFIEQFWTDEKGSGPANALKTQLYRIRTLLESLFGSDFQPILSQRGGYEWNPEIETHVDTDAFEALVHRANQSDLTEARRRGILEEAITLYRGDFLPKLSKTLWVIPVSTKYHGQYLDCVTAYAALLERDDLFEEMFDLAEHALTIDALSEDLHVLLLRSLLHQGKNSSALAHYEYATDLLYRNLGIQQWRGLRELYDSIMATEQVFETDLSVIMQELKETTQDEGVFFCEYGFFREIYRLEARRTPRTGNPIHVALVTISTQSGEVPELRMLDKTMTHLREVLVHSLRNGDVAARYSGAQYVLMLPGASLTDSEYIISRILSRFRRKYRMSPLKISSHIRAIEINDAAVADEQLTVDN
jgi:DNA-binding SARP family transcriptional activator